jgi:hypothetical protein
MEGQLCHHQETTSGISDTLATVNKTIAAAVCVFHEFVPGAPFHPLISHSTAALPTNSVNPSHTNSLLERDKHQSVSKSPSPWGSLIHRHICHTHQQNHSFRTSIYTIPACRSTFTPITTVLSLAQSIPSWVFSHFGLVGATRLSPCGSGGLVVVDLRDSRLG